MFYVIDSTNSINNATDNVKYAALQLDVGDNLLVQYNGSVLATGASSDAVYLDGYGTNDTITVNGLILGTRSGIYSLGQYASITVNGQVIGGSTGISIANSAKLFVSATGLVSGSEGVSLLGGSTLINDGTVNGSGNDAIQMSDGFIVNNGLISSSFSAISYDGDGAGRITNTGTIQGSLDTYYAASAVAAKLDIDNSGNWNGSLNLTPGDDTVINTGKITGSVSLGDGADMLDSRCGLITGNISGGAGNDIIWAGVEDDTIDGGAGADIIDGRGGVNTVSYSSSLVGVRVNLMTGVAKYGDAAGDTLSHIQNLNGTLQNDVLIGDNRDNLLVGVLGKDVLTGNGGNDTFVMYGDGPVIISGGAGNDLIKLTTIDSMTYGYAFSAQSRIDGGTGYNTLDLTNCGAVVFAAATVVNVERIVVEDGFNYKLTTANATVGSGNLLEVDAGALTGTHWLQFDGSAETNGKFVIDGGAGNDIFKGGAGNDSLAGGAGNDLLRGGFGIDVLNGGLGHDSLVVIAGSSGTTHFTYENVTDSGVTAATRDTIVGFDHGSSGFDFAGIDAKTSTVVDDAFVFIGTAAFSAAGQIRVVSSGTDVLVQLNTGGTLAADMSILVKHDVVSNFTDLDFFHL